MTGRREILSIGSDPSDVQDGDQSTLSFSLSVVDLARHPDEQIPTELSATRVITAAPDTGSATEDGPVVVIPVLSNDVGVAAVARINGISVSAGSVVTLASGAQVLVNADGTVSYAVGGAFQALGAGQTAQDSFTYVGTDGGASALAPEGTFNLSAINGSNGFVINGGAAGDRSGYSVAGIGDMNGDGIADLLISALSADPNREPDAGSSYVVFGRRGGFGPSLDLSSLNGTNGFAINGGDPLDYSGASVSRAGDVNGDGFADLIVGAPWAESNRGANAGEAYVVFGRSSGFGATLDVNALTGTNGFVIRGTAANDGLGFSVSAAGDLNGDGFGDLIVGARGVDGRGVDSGASYVVFGRAGGFSAGIDVSSLNGTNGYTITGANGGDQSGFVVSAAGDINGDGLADLVVGAPTADPGGRADAGQAFVVFGQRGVSPASVNLAALNGVNGFSISGARAGDHAGWSVASIGDVNGDGIADLALGAVYADPGNRESAGETYVVFGRLGGFGPNLELSTLSGATGFVIAGGAALNLTGHSISSAGDINGDGLADLLVSALYADGAGGADSGETYVVFGRLGGFSGVLDPSLLNGLNGFIVGGTGAGSFSGNSVSAAGDVNGDGIDDLVIGAPNADPGGRTDAGTSYVIYGSRDIESFTGETTVTITVTGTNDAPIITSGGGGVTSGVSVGENTTAVTTVIAGDADASAGLTYAIVGGADGQAFSINPQTGALEFVSPPNFEAPTDQETDNVYEVIVQASDGSLTDTQTLSVTVLNMDEPPLITSDGGGATASVMVGEGATGVTTVVADQPDGTALTYSIIGGADAALFRIDAQTGLLEFVTAPDFESPTDQGGDNVYDVVVQASDGQLTDNQALQVQVTDVLDMLSLTDVEGLIAVNEGDGPRLLDMDVTLIGPASGYSGGTLRVSGLVNDDVVTIRSPAATAAPPTFPAPTGISVSQNMVAFDGVVFGTFSGGQGTNLVVTFNASAGRTAIERLIEALEYRSSSDIPVPSHDLTLQISDGGGLMSAPVGVKVQFTADILIGTDQDDVRSGFRGDDDISGFGGVDTLSGGVGSDTIRGGPGADTIDGGDDNDFLFGDGGSDFLIGGGGDNEINGGSGTDTVRYPGNFQDFDFGFGNNGELFVYRQDGTDILTNVEFLQFDQQTVDVSTLGGSPIPIEAFDKFAGPVICLEIDEPMNSAMPAASSPDWLF